MVTLRKLTTLFLLLALNACKTPEEKNWAPTVYAVGDWGLESTYNAPIPYNSNTAKNFLCIDRKDMFYLVARCIEEVDKPWYRFW